MAELLDQPRYMCAMSAMRTVQAIDSALPILHSGSGCAEKLTGSVGSSGHFSPHIFPCSNISENEVVFGGSEQLRETIDAALKVIDADLYLVLSSCASEIIGDDIEEVVRSFQGGRHPVLFASTPGFKGNSYIGHESVIDALIEQHLKPAPQVIEGLVNIWAGVPYQDIFWAGDYKALEGLVTELGLTPNTIFGFDHGIEQIEKISAAQFNLLVSPWVGLKNVQKLEEKFDTPFLHIPTLPIGAFETSSFLRAVSDFSGLDSERTEQIITAREREYYHYIERYADVFLETRAMARMFTVVADAQTTLSFTKFLVNDLGLLPAKQYITDGVPEEYQDAIKGYFKDLNYNIKAEVSFTSDGYVIQEEIRDTDYHGYPLILGSSWEKKVALELHAHYLTIAWPIVERLVINGSYVGYDGGLKLLEDIYSIVFTRFN